ncbi:hypothetical protein EV356DRAFT_505448 [Viridothelium virens]|uniref:Uncharacterized protein n=1 Tax=Viridothelium virens TaxID=1048519 RepID=A0A6A6H2Z9_VIRVR|nr:hypothetical protein EV356DRAFT_505448 [Viridothelium virens]
MLVSRVAITHMSVQTASAKSASPQKCEPSSAFSSSPTILVSGYRSLTQIEPGLPRRNWIEAPIRIESGGGCARGSKAMMVPKQLLMYSALKRESDALCLP